MAHDNRKHLRAAHPSKRTGDHNVVQIHLNAAQYRKVYDMAAVRGTSLNEIIRGLIDGQR